MTHTLRALALSLALAAGVVVAKADTPEMIQPSVWAANPDIAAFDKGIDQHLAAARASIAQLVALKGTRTADNTLRLFDDALREVNTVAYQAGLVEGTHPDAAFRDHGTKAVVKASSAYSDIQLNPDVYRALSAIDAKNEDAATQYYLQRTLLEFRLAGVDKDARTRAELKRLQDVLTEQVSMYDRNIADDVRHVRVLPADLAGLPADFIAAHKPGADGKVSISTAYPDSGPVYRYAQNAELRRSLSTLDDNRGYPKNLAVLREMLKTREKIANLLGYKTWADYNAADKMIGTGANIGAFIEATHAATQEPAKRELQMLLAEKRKVEPAATGLTVADATFYKERVRRAAYDFDSQSVRPYFPYESVKQGIIGIASELFHIGFEREPNAVTWAPGVESWLVRDQGRVIGRIYLDMHPREGKYSHAAMFQVLDGVRGRQLPEAALICNFPAPTATDPALMDVSDVTTFFHEFGHLVHHILGGQQRWAGISGITMESDFGEAPSQMLEELIRSPDVLARFAKHYQTGEPIPKELVERMNRASAFGRAMWVQRQLVYTALSYDLHRLPAATVNADAVSDDDAKRYTSVALLPGTHQWASIGHLGEYSSQYYTYLWDKVIALDFYRQFNAEKPLEGDAAMRYRRTVLEPGGSQSANDLVKNFIGRPQDVAVMKDWIGAEFAPAQ